MPSDCPYCGKPHFNFGDDEEGVEMWINEPNDGEYVIVADPPFAWSTPINFCPFCGGPAEIVDNSRYDPGTYFVGCLYCGARSDYEHGEENAAELWNGRVESNGD